MRLTSIFSWVEGSVPVGSGGQGGEGQVGGLWGHQGERGHQGQCQKKADFKRFLKKTANPDRLSTSMTVRGFYNKSYTSQKTYFIINSSTIYFNEPIKISWTFNNKWFYHEVFKTDSKSGLSTSTTGLFYHKN